MNFNKDIRVRLDAATKARLEEIAKEKGITFSEIIRQAINGYLINEFEKNYNIRQLDKINIDLINKFEALKEIFNQSTKEIFKKRW